MPSAKGSNICSSRCLAAGMTEGFHRWRRVRYLGRIFEVVMRPRYNDRTVLVWAPGQECYAPIADVELL